MFVTISDAKKTLNKLVTSTDTSIITKNGNPTAAVMPYDEYIKYERLLREKEDMEAIQRAEEYFTGKRKGVSQKEIDNLLGPKNDQNS